MSDRAPEIRKNLIDMAEEMGPWLSAFRRNLHAHPELGWMEMRTSSLLARELRKMGCDKILMGDQVLAAESRMGVPGEEELEAHYRWAEAHGADPEYLPPTRGGMTGVIGVLNCGPGPVVALRFDIDALPVCECTSKNHEPAREGFASQVEGVMHACGHDGHAAVGIGTAKLLCKMRDQLCGTVKFIFQPAEEGVRGAKSIVEKGHLDDADYLLGAHMGGDSELKEACIGLGPNRTFATSKMDVTFTGKSAHACFAPEEGRNAMLAMAAAVLNLHAIPRDGRAATRINVGQVSAGSGRNVICDRAEMKMEVRGMTSEANEYMRDYAKRVIRAAADMHGCSCSIEIVGEAKGDINSPEFLTRVGEICRDQLGLKAVELPDNPSGGVSEDYSFMSDRVRSHGGQSVYMQNMTAMSAGLHHDNFDFREEALVNGVKAFAGVTAELLKKEA